MLGRPAERAGGCLGVILSALDPEKRPLTDPARILMIRPSALGDVCRTVPCLVSLRRAFPAATIDWLVNDAFVPAVSAHPALNAAVAFDRRAFGDGIKRLQLGAARSFMGELKARGYDLVVDLQGLARSGLLAWSTRAKRRVGYANARELGWLGCNERHHVDASIHAVDRMLRLIELAGVRPVLDMRLYTPVLSTVPAGRISPLVVWVNSVVSREAARHE